MNTDEIKKHDRRTATYARLDVLIKAHYKDYVGQYLADADMGGFRAHKTADGQWCHLQYSVNYVDINGGTITTEVFYPSADGWTSSRQNCNKKLTLLGLAMRDSVLGDIVDDAVAIDFCWKIIESEMQKELVKGVDYGRGSLQRIHGVGNVPRGRYQYKGR